MRIEVKMVTRVFVGHEWHDVEPGSFDIDYIKFTRGQGLPPIKQSGPYDTIAESNVHPIDEIIWGATWLLKGTTFPIYYAPVRDIEAVTQTPMPK
jgi:hypothetical protein